jgi:hypothetical protein
MLHTVFPNDFTPARCRQDRRGGNLRVPLK